MTDLHAFVGHSFTHDDSIVVRKFLDYLEQISGVLPGFSWVHAEAAEPKQLAEKVLTLLDGKNLFIGICTKKECVVDTASMKPNFLQTGFKINCNALVWKTSDWIIQEIGLAIGKGLYLILLIENGVRQPGGLQSSVEYISFDRERPQEAFGKILEMIRALSPRAAASPSASVPNAPQTADQSEPSADPDFADVFENPQPDWGRLHYEVGFMQALFGGNSEIAAKISEAYLATKEAHENDNATTWRAFCEYRRIISGDGGRLANLEEIIEEENKQSSEALRWLALAQAYYRDFHKSAKTYEIAASYAGDNVTKVELLGEAAVAYAQGGKTIQQGI